MNYKKAIDILSHFNNTGILLPGAKKAFSVLYLDD